jgi:serine/threonine-protein kinase Chk1
VAVTEFRPSIKKAIPLEEPTPVFAVKFIHKAYAIRRGRITAKQLNLEITLHHHLGHHVNIVQFFRSGEDAVWTWIAMELAEGGDLFDKIESDVGVGEDVAHLYFTQLISAVAYMHSKGVAHRDLKPENILLSAEGDLKIADFGLAALFVYKGERKLCPTSAGSPPYTAPEVITCDTARAKMLKQGYYGDYVDIWSCGVILFVLLAGNTPWDEPLESSYEFSEYVRTNGRPDDELWQKLPPETLSLLRGLMKIEPTERLSLDDVRRHPWFTRPNPYLSKDGKLTNPVALATQMFQSMKIDFDQDPMASSQRHQTATDAMDIDSQDWQTKLASTQPETPSSDLTFDWERPPGLAATTGVSNSQPNANGVATLVRGNSIEERLAEDPSFSQFSATPTVPLSRTQFARQFGDIIPAHSLARFFSLWAFPALVPLLFEALHRLSVPVPSIPSSTVAGNDNTASITVKTVDTRKCELSGFIVAEALQGVNEGLVEVNFIKKKGDPVEWRRFFKKIVVLCKDAVYTPEG